MARRNDGLFKCVLFSFCCLIFASVPSRASVNVLFSTTSIQPGETLRIETDGIASNRRLRIFIHKSAYPFFPIGTDVQRALVGIRLDAAPGKFPVHVDVQANGAPDWQTVYQGTIEISSKTFPTETVNFNPEKTALFRWEHQESARIHQLLLYLTNDQSWEGMFDYPVQGPVIGEFGVHRIRNGNIDAGFHKGVDLKADKGTPILASSSGVVLLAAVLKAHGRTVLLNHGQGVMTIYLHMNAITVKPGQKVVKGQKIGIVGSSGLSTAPHVHWGLYVHGVPVDPKPWTETEF